MTDLCSSHHPESSQNKYFCKVKKNIATTQLGRGRESLHLLNKRKKLKRKKKDPYFLDDTRIIKTLIIFVHGSQEAKNENRVSQIGGSVLSKGKQIR